VLIRLEDERVVRLLESNAVVERSDEMPQMEWTCRPITSQQARTVLASLSGGWIP
jgi:hypothetical protein